MVAFFVQSVKISKVFRFILNKILFFDDSYTTKSSTMKPSIKQNFMSLQGRITAASNHLIYLIYVLYHILPYVKGVFKFIEKMVYFVGV